jgi:hypothetical protein
VSRGESATIQDWRVEAPGSPVTAAAGPIFPAKSVHSAQKKQTSSSKRGWNWDEYFVQGESLLYIVYPPPKHTFQQVFYTSQDWLAKIKSAIKTCLTNTFVTVTSLNLKRQYKAVDPCPHGQDSGHKIPRHQVGQTLRKSPLMAADST